MATGSASWSASRREARDRQQQRREARALFDAAVSDAGLAPVADADDFAALASLVADERPRLTEAKRDLDAPLAEAIAREKDFERRRDPMSPRSSPAWSSAPATCPREQVDVRAQLCDDLGLTPDDLPYAGELLDVDEQHAQWRGAAERVLRGFALSLLVPQRTTTRRRLGQRATG